MKILTTKDYENGIKNNNRAIKLLKQARLLIPDKRIDSLIKDIEGLTKNYRKHAYETNRN